MEYNHRLWFNHTTRLPVKLNVLLVERFQCKNWDDLTRELLQLYCLGAFLYEMTWIFRWWRQLAFSECTPSYPCFMLHHFIKLPLTNRARARASRRKPIQMHLENQLLATCRKGKKLTNLLIISNIASSSISILSVCLL